MTRTTKGTSGSRAKGGKSGAAMRAKKGTAKSRKPGGSKDAVAKAAPAKKSAKVKNAKGATAHGSKKNSLVGNINKRRKAGTSRPKSESTVSEKSYKQLKEGWR